MQNRPQKFLPSLYGGIVIATISSVPGLSLINCFCCAGVIAGGITAVYFYNKELTPEMLPLTAGDGVVLGGLAGIIAAFLSVLLHLAVYIMFGNIAARIAYEVFRSILETSNLPAEIADAVEEALRVALEQGLTPLLVFIQLAQDLFLFTLFGVVGGLIGYALFKRKGPQTQPAAPSA